MFKILVEDGSGDEAMEFAVKAGTEAEAEMKAWSYARNNFSWIAWASTVPMGEIDTVPAGATAI